MLRVGRILAVALVTVGTVACGDDVTEIVVAVDADPGVRARAVRIDVVVEGPSGRSQTTSAPIVGGDAQPLPFTLGLVPAGDTLGPVTVSAIAYDAAGAEVAARRARTSFIRARTLLLVLQLEDACMRVTCMDASATCVNGTCVPIDIEPSSLPPWTGTIPIAPAPDAGTDMDAGEIDAGGPGPGFDAAAPVPDAGIPDLDAAAVPDAGQNDGGGCDPGSCSDGVACTLDFCTGLGCVNTPGDEFCSAAPGGICHPARGCEYPTCTPATCDDGNPCTDDVCMGSVCIRSDNSSPCDDGNACTIGDSCTTGACMGMPRTCDDSNPCTVDSCGPGGCLFGLVSGTACDDGNACTMGDMCAGGTCVPGALFCFDAGFRPDGGRDAGHDAGHDAAFPGGPDGGGITFMDAS